jgi:hypothetical protein
MVEFTFYAVFGAAIFTMILSAICLALLTNEPRKEREPLILLTVFCLMVIAVMSNYL